MASHTRGPRRRAIVVGGFVSVLADKAIAHSCLPRGRHMRAAQRWRTHTHMGSSSRAQDVQGGPLPLVRRT